MALVLGLGSLLVLVLFGTASVLGSAYAACSGALAVLVGRRALSRRARGRVDRSALVGSLTGAVSVVGAVAVGVWLVLSRT